MPKFCFVVISTNCLWTAYLPSSVCQKWSFFSTCGNSPLNQILTGIDNYTPAEDLPPLVGNEQYHCCIYLPGQNLPKNQYKEAHVRQCSKESRNKLLVHIAMIDCAVVEWASSLDTTVGEYTTLYYRDRNQHARLWTIDKYTKKDCISANYTATWNLV